MQLHEEIKSREKWKASAKIFFSEINQYMPSPVAKVIFDYAWSPSAVNTFSLLNKRFHASGSASRRKKLSQEEYQLFLMLAKNTDPDLIVCLDPKQPSVFPEQFIPFMEFSMLALKICMSQYDEQTINKFATFFDENAPDFNKKIKNLYAIHFKKDKLSKKDICIDVAHRVFKENLSSYEIMKFSRANIFFDTKDYLRPNLNESKTDIYIKEILDNYVRYQDPLGLIRLVFQTLKGQCQKEKKNFIAEMELRKDAIFKLFINAKIHWLCSSKILLFLQEFVEIFTRRVVVEELLKPSLKCIQDKKYAALYLSQIVKTLEVLKKENLLDQSLLVDVFFHQRDLLQKLIQYRLRIPMSPFFKESVVDINHRIHFFLKKLSAWMNACGPRSSQQNQALKRYLSDVEYCIGVCARYFPEEFEPFVFEVKKLIRITTMVRNQVKHLCNQENVDFSSLVSILNNNLSKYHELRFLTMLYYGILDGVQKLSVHCPGELHVIFAQISILYNLNEELYSIDIFDENFFESCQILPGELPKSQYHFFTSLFSQNPYQQASMLFTEGECLTGVYRMNR